MSNFAYRSFFVDLHRCISNEELKSVDELYSFMEQEYHKLIQDYLASGIVYSKKLLVSKSDFRNQFLKDFGNRNNDWDEKKIAGNRAKYYRMIIENLRRLLLSLVEREEVAKVCKTHNWDFSKKKDIRNDLIAKNLYPKEGVLRNVLRSKSSPRLPTKSVLIIDFASEDARVSKVQSNKISVDVQLRIFKNWVNFTIPAYPHIGDFKAKVTRPLIRRDRDTGSLIIQFAYEVPVWQTASSENHMGIDIGQNKPFAASIIGKDFYTTELSPSKETSNLGKKIENLTKERGRLYEKISNIEKFGVLSEHFVKERAASIEKLRSEINKMNNKLSKLRKQLSNLIARDLLYHCLVNDVKSVNLEDLAWLDSKGGKWNHSDMRDKIYNRLSLAGIEVFEVYAKHTSHIDPFSGEKISYDKDRKAKTEKGLLDRDYLASMEIAKRKGKCYNRKDKYNPRKEKTLKEKRCRDKHAPTPKRAKIMSKKKAWKTREEVEKLKEKIAQNRKNINYFEHKDELYTAVVGLAKASSVISENTLVNKTFNYDNFRNSMLNYCEVSQLQVRRVTSECNFSARV